MSENALHLNGTWTASDRVAAAESPRQPPLVALTVAAILAAAIAVDLTLGWQATAAFVAVALVAVDRIAWRPARIAGRAGGPQLDRVPLATVAHDRWFAQSGSTLALDAAHAGLKRALDLAVVLVLGLMVIPVLPLIALAIRLESPGSVFYSQTRVGLGGRLFRIYKFRSMRHDAERGGAQYAQAGDPRVTRVGRFMRLTRIDELPQLWNVLKGEMTLVGPRPERPEFTAVYERDLPGFAKRHAVKPGLTGWAQVRYRYASSAEDTARKLEYDLYYLKNLSLLLDLRILVETVRVVVQKAGC